MRHCERNAFQWQILFNPQEKTPHTDKLPNGVVLGENYRILSVDAAYNNKTNDESKIVRLRSTTGIHRAPASNGDILDVSNVKLSKGEFFMPFKSWVNTFTHLEVVHLDGDTSRDEPSLQDKVPWVVRLYQGQWRKGVTAGGCRNFAGRFTTSTAVIAKAGGGHQAACAGDINYHG